MASPWDGRTKSISKPIPRGAKDIYTAAGLVRALILWSIRRWHRSCFTDGQPGMTVSVSPADNLPGYWNTLLLRLLLLIIDFEAIGVCWRLSVSLLVERMC